MPTLVFLESHDGELTKGGLGVLGKAASLGGDVAGVVLGSGVRDAAAAAGGFGASTVYVVDDDALAAPLPQPRVDALEAVVAGLGRRHRPLCRIRPRGGRRGGARRAARRGPQLGPHRPAPGGRRARGRAARARRHGARRGGLDLDAAARPDPGGDVRPRRVGRVGRGEGRVRDLPGLLHAGTARRAPDREGERPVDRGCRRDRRRRQRARRPGGVLVLRGARRGARRRGRRDPRGRRRRLVPVRGAGGPDRQDGLAEALHRARHLGRDPAQGRHAGLRDDRRRQQGPERPDLRLRRPRRRRRSDADRAEADGAAPGPVGERRPPGRLPAAVRELGGDRPADGRARRADRRRHPHRRRRPRRARVRYPARPAPGGAPGRARAARRGAGRAPREGEAARLAPPFRRRDEPAGDPQAVRGPHGDRGDADIRAGPRRGRLPADQGRRPADPAAADDDEPRELDRLGVRARPLPRRAGRSGRDDDPARDSGPEAPRRARPGRRRAHGRQGPWQGRRAAAELRARGRRHGTADRPRRGDGGPPDDCGDRRVRARGPEPADLGARRERGVACSASRSGRSSTPWGGRCASVRGTASSAARSSIRWARTTSRWASSSGSSTRTSSCPPTTSCRSSRRTGSCARSSTAASGSRGGRRRSRRAASTRSRRGSTAPGFSSSARAPGSSTCRA